MDPELTPELELARVDAALGERVVEAECVTGDHTCAGLGLRAQGGRLRGKAGVRDRDELSARR